MGPDYFFDQMGGPTDPERNYLIARGNYLLSRWNELDSQGNLYLFGGMGAVHSGKDSSAAWLAGIEADWESRKYYTSFRGAYLDSAFYREQTFYQGRVGLAPYLAKFEGFNSWVIFQVQYWPSAQKEKLRMGPLMRFYIENVLWELGVTARGTWMFNTMVHF